MREQYKVRSFTVDSLESLEPCLYCQANCTGNMEAKSDGDVAGLSNPLIRHVHEEASVWNDLHSQRTKGFAEPRQPPYHFKKPRLSLTESPGSFQNVRSRNDWTTSTLISASLIAWTAYNLAAFLQAIYSTPILQI
jgi:hypothetical protein